MAPITEALSVVVVALLVIYVTRRLLFSSQRKLKLPPGPSPLPIIGSLHLLGTLPHKSLADLAKTHGPLMSLRLGHKLYIVATSPETAREFLKVQDANFCSRPPSRAVEVILPKDLGFHDITPVTRHLRKIVVSEVTSAKRLEASKDIRADELAYMLRMLSREKAGPILIKTHFHIFATNIVSRMVLNKRFLGEPGDAMSAVMDNSYAAFEFITLTEDIMHHLGAIHPQDYFNFLPLWFDPQRLEPKFRNLVQRLHNFYTTMVHEHTEHRKMNPVSDDKKSFLDVLLQELDNPDIDVTAEHVSCLIWNILFAATDTTKIASEWAVAEILRSASVLEEVRAELERVVGSERVVAESDVPHLPYMQAVVKEVLRLHPPTPMLIPHQSLHATNAFGYDIPEKTRVFVNSWGISRDPKVWESPLEFQPERFLEGGLHAGIAIQGQQNFDMLPFGSGRRSCPGASFAVMTVALQVASLVHAFDLSCAGGIEKLDMSERATFMLSKRDPLLVVATPRLPSHLY